MHVPIIMHVHVRCMGRPGLSTFMQGPTIQRIHIQGLTIQTYEGPQGPGTMLLKSGTIPEIRGPLRPMVLSPRSRKNGAPKAQNRGYLETHGPLCQNR